MKRNQNYKLREQTQLDQQSVNIAEIEREPKFPVYLKPIEERRSNEKFRFIFSVNTYVYTTRFFPTITSFPVEMLPSCEVSFLQRPSISENLQKDLFTLTRQEGTKKNGTALKHLAATLYLPLSLNPFTHPICVHIETLDDTQSLLHAYTFVHRRCNCK